MRALVPALLLLAGCQSVPIVGSGAKPVERPLYTATSHDPFWIVTVGTNEILLTSGPAGGRADGELTSTSYLMPAASQTGEVRRWQAGQGTAVISLEARATRCTTGGRSYPDTVVVRLSGREMKGCGGPGRGDEK